MRADITTTVVFIFNNLYSLLLQTCPVPVLQAPMTAQIKQLIEYYYLKQSEMHFLFFLPGGQKKSHRLILKKGILLRLIEYSMTWANKQPP